MYCLEFLKTYKCTIEDICNWFCLYDTDQIEELDFNERFHEVAAKYYNSLDQTIKNNKTYEEVENEMFYNMIEMFDKIFDIFDKNYVIF